MPSATPDPLTHPEFYDNVPAKRLIAWVIDIALTALFAAPLIVPTAAIGMVLFFPILMVPFIWAAVGFIYRWVSLSMFSGTLGMLLMSIQLRDIHGQKISGTTAFLHTLGTTFSFGMMPVQAVSVALMATTPRGQGLTDLVLGTTMLNKSAP